MATTWVDRNEGAKALGTHSANAFVGYVGRYRAKVRSKAAPLPRAPKRRLWSLEDVLTIKSNYKPLGPRKKKRATSIAKLNAALSVADRSSLTHEAELFVMKIAAADPDIFQIHFDVKNRKAVVERRSYEELNFGGGDK